MRGSAKITAFILAAAAAFMPVYGYQQNSSAIVLECDFETGGMKFNYLGNTDEKKLMLVEVDTDAEELTVPESIDGVPVVGIQNHIFKNSKIKKVSLPDTIIYFGQEVFRESEIESVNIPRSLRIIPDRTFYGCKDLKDVGFHENIITCSGNAFTGTNIAPPEDILNSIDGKYIPNSLSAWLADEDWQYEVNLDLNSERYYIKVRYTGDSADAVVPESYMELPVEQVYYDCFKSYGIKSVVFPESVKTAAVEFNNETLTDIKFLGDSVKLNEYGHEMKLANTGVTSVELPVNELGTTCRNCRNLKEVSLTGGGELYIGDKAFQDSRSFSDISFSDRYTRITIGDNAFEGTAMTSFSVAQPCTIGAFAFGSGMYTAPRLETVFFGSDATLDHSAFRGCGSLRSVTFSGNADIYADAFMDCTALENIDISTDIAVKGAAFNGCTALRTINSVPVFDEKTGEFNESLRDYVMANFIAADDVGFLNDYVTAQVKKIVAENVTPDMSDVEKVKVLHDWVCRNTKYSSNTVSSPEYHTDISVLLCDETVCEGYARMCNLLYQEAGLETCCVISADHLWNIVKIGGHYFHVDSTWDDGDEITRDWFMKSDDFMKKADGSHSRWSLFDPSSLHSFRSGELPKCPYSVGDVNTDGETSVADMVRLCNVLLGEAKINAENEVLYDTTFDGKIDAFDMVEMRKMVLGA